MATGIAHEHNHPLSVIKTASSFFINLLLNARDAIEENWDDQETGQVDKRIILKTKSDRPFVVCTVCDTGKGIDQKSHFQHVGNLQPSAVQRSRPARDSMAALPISREESSRRSR